MSKTACLLLPAVLTLTTCSKGPVDPVHIGPMAKSKANPELNLPAYQTGGGDGLRIVVEPNDIYSYRFDFRPVDKGCKIYDQRSDGNRTVGVNYCDDIMVFGVRLKKAIHDQPKELLSFKFLVEANDFANFFNGLKTHLARWDGSVRGEPGYANIGVEMHSRGQLKSYSANVHIGQAPENPAAFAGFGMHALAIAYAPEGLIPHTSNWVATYPPDTDPCNEPGFFQADSDGFGIGDDHCSRRLAHPEKYMP